MSPLSGEIWEMIAVITYSEASVSTTMGLSGLKCAKMGAWVKAVLRASNALVWLGPQAKGVSLCVRQMRGMMVSENPRMPGLLEVSWGWPYTDCIGLGCVHGDAS